MNKVWISAYSDFDGEVLYQSEELYDVKELLQAEAEADSWDEELSDYEGFTAVDILRTLAEEYDIPVWKYESWGDVEQAVREKLEAEENSASL